MFILLFLTVAVFTLLAVFHIYNTKDNFTSFDDFLTARNHLGAGAGAATVLASIMGAWILFSPAEAGTWGGDSRLWGICFGPGNCHDAFCCSGPPDEGFGPQGHNIV